MEIIDVNTLFGAYPSQHPDSTPESLVAVLESQKVSLCLTLSSWGLFHNDLDGNAETLRACQSHPSLRPMATLNPTGYWGQPGLVAQLAASQFVMFRFFPKTQSWPLDFAPFAAILRALGEGPAMPVLVTVDQPGQATVLARVVADYPYPVIMAGISERNLTEAIAVMRGNDRLMLETHSLYSPDALPLLRDTVGISRVLFGSQAPGMSLGAALLTVQKSSLSETDQQAVLSGNARRIWPSNKI